MSNIGEIKHAVISFIDPILLRSQEEIVLVTRQYQRKNFGLTETAVFMQINTDSWSCVDTHVWYEKILTNHVSVVIHEQQRQVISVHHFSKLGWSWFIFCSLYVFSVVSINKPLYIEGILPKGPYLPLPKHGG